MSLPLRGPARRPGPRVSPATNRFALARNVRHGTRTGNLSPVACVLALAISLQTPVACAPSPSRANAPKPAVRNHTGAAEATAGATMDAYPETVAFREGTLQRFSYREFELPAGANLTDCTEHLAAYAKNGPENRHSTFGLLDLVSGRTRIVLTTAVNEQLGYSPLSPRISDTWLAWEELSPNEDTDPGNTAWCLYAAKIDRTKLALGRPVLLDRGVTNYRLRPHFAVLGSTVIWSANLRAGPNQERFPRAASVKSLDVKTGRQRVLLRTSTSYPTLCASDGMVWITEALGATDRADCRVLLVDPATGMVGFSCDLANTARISHFVRASSDWLSWAIPPSEGAEWPNLYLAPRTGASSPTASAPGTSRVPAGTLMVGTGSIDPAFFGRYVAFESVAAASAAGGGLKARVRRILVADPATRERTVLLQTADGDGGGWWQTCASGPRTNALVVSNDLGPWTEDPLLAKTLVRVYTSAVGRAGE